MSKQANVTLKALSGDVSIAERTIILNPNQLTVPIGRSSKSISKGLLGAPDNAWFDSPVMSRDHAEMCLNPEINVVTIHDIGSMHGTYVNKRQLPRKEPQQVSDGDEITFGAQVNRGLEVFPACAFKLKLDFVPFKPTNSYAFPESSDIEDEEEEDLSEDPAEEDSHSSCEDDASVEMDQPVKKLPPMNAIDLTGDDSPFVPSNHIDLTGEPSAENHANGTANEVSLYKYNAYPIVLESEDEDEEEDDDYGQFPSDSEIQSVIADSTESESSEDEEVHEDDDTESEDDAEGEDSDSIMEGHTEDLVENSGEDYLRDDMNHFLGADHSLNGFTSDVQEPNNAPEDVMDDDDESDFGLSEAGEAGITALFEGGLLHSDSDASEPASDKETRADSEQQATETTQIASPGASFAQVWDGDAVDLLYKAAKLNPPSTFTGTLHQPFFGARQPSPSDAAMVKSAPQKLPEQTQNDVPVFHGRAFGNLTQTLGDKTGKHAFFEARENNKAKVQAPAQEDKDNTFPQSFTTSGSFFSSHPRRNEHTYHYEPSAPTPTSLTSAKFGEPSNFAGSSNTNKFEDFAATKPASPFDLQDQPQSLKRAPSPEYDMTSAVKFNESKAKSVRSRLSIHDIIENSSRDQASQERGPQIGEKRKANEISNVIESEIREWASLDTSSPSDAASSNSPAEKPNQEATATGSLAQQTDEHRPVKKLKTILGNAAYATLGGVAVGAGLFFSLIATAPDFA